MNRFIVLVSLFPLLFDLGRDALYIVKESLKKENVTFDLIKLNVFFVGFLLFIVLWTWYGITFIIQSFAERGVDFRLGAFVGINAGYLLGKLLIRLDKTLKKYDKGKHTDKDIAIYFKYIVYPFGALFGISVVAFLYIVYHPEF